MLDKSSPHVDESQTCWTLIHSAASGCQESLNLFIRRYDHVVRRTLAVRWQGSWRMVQIDDAVQDVFLECIRPQGVLSKADSRYSGGFRALLFGVTRNVMRRFETQRLATHGELPEIVTPEATVSRAFDRELAQSIMKEASRAQLRIAEGRGEAALRRVKLLKARFEEGEPIREIAQTWMVDPDWLHRQYSKARQEFLEALLQVIASYQPNATDAENVQTCRELLGLLG